MTFMKTLTFLLALGSAAVQAQSLDFPSKCWGLSIGNSKEFTGLRFNFRDSQVKSIDGVNITLWQPRKDNEEAVITGLSFGTIPGGGRLRGVQIGLLGIAGARRSPASPWPGSAWAPATISSGSTLRAWAWARARTWKASTSPAGPAAWST